MSKSSKISSSELEVMRILWRHKRPMSGPEIRKILQDTQQWDKSTILTLIKRLTEKEVLHKETVSCDKKDIFYYTPTVTEEEYTDYQSNTLISKLYNGSLKNYVVALCDRNRLTDEELQELREYFQEGSKP